MSDLRNKVHSKLHKRFGVDATYTPLSGVGVPVVVKLNIGVETYGDVFELTGNEDQLVLLLSDIPNPKQKETFLINGVTYYLSKKLKDDGVRQIWSVVD